MGTGFVQDFAQEIAERAERIEREKNGKALTPEEASDLKVAYFLKRIAPYLFEEHR